jgi:serine/threonine-protein kinase
MPEGLNNLILKAMEKEPISRYQNIKDIILDLQRLKNNSEYKVELANQNSEHTKVMAPVSLNDDRDDENPKKSKKKLALILIPLFIMVIVVGFFAGFLLEDRKSKINENAKNEIIVPNIIGLTEAQATSELEAKGLKLVVDSREKSDKAEGTIFSSNPTQGSKVNANTEVRVSVSTGTDKPVVPNVQDFDIKAAKKVIENNGFKLAPIQYDYSDTVPMDIVISQTPVGDTPGDTNTEITLVVSKGPETKYTTMPDVVLRSVKEADSLLQSLNLKLGKQTEIETDKESLGGKIADQSIKANTENVKEGTAVDVSVYKYVAPVKVPNFDHLSYKEAEALASENGLKIAAVDNKTDGLVTGQNPVAGSDVKKGSTITLTFTVETPATPTGSGTSQ